VTELDRAGLDRVLPSAAAPADWDDVLGRARTRDGRRRRVLALAAVATVAVAAASGFAARELLVLDRGFIGLPPEGATPSAPENGELVVSYVGRSVALNNEFRRVWVYADGRVIWYRGGENLDLGGNPLEVGFLERRLTPEGVELVRSELLATGLFDHDRELVGGPFVGATAQVREGDRLVRVAWNAAVYPAEGPTATVDQVNALRRIDSLAADLDAWLPASAWEARKARAYVAPRYAVCTDSDPTLLPEPVQALLHGYELVRKASAWIQLSCAVVPTDAARAIDRALAAAGLEAGDGLGKNEGRYRQVYRLPGVEDEALVGYVFFEPMLPHGEWVCTPCG
jgi:hypothetical protein